MTEKLDLSDQSKPEVKVNEMVSKQDKKGRAISDKAMEPCRAFPQKILFIKPSSLGDIFHAIPAFYLLKAANPHCKIDWLINENFAPVLEYIKDDLNRVIYFDRQVLKKRGAVGGLIKLIKSIRQERYDLVIDFQGLLRSSLMAFVARAKRKAGFRDTKEKISSILYNEKIKVPEEYKHAIERNAYLVSETLGKEYTVPDYSLDPIEKHKKSVLNILKKNNINDSKYIVIAPGARWETKSWPPTFFANVSNAIKAVYPGLDIVLIGSASDKVPANTIVSQCHSPRPVSLAGQTNICELVEVIRGARILLTNDSGPMHIAAALRVPVFALFGPTDPQKTGPYWPWHKIYQSQKGCIKCFRRDCSIKTLECQKNISYQDVADDIVEELKKLDLAKGLS